MPRKNKRVAKKHKQNDSRGFAFIAAFLSIIGFVIALIVKKDDEYVMFYAKQSLVVFITAAILGIAGKILLILPIIGRIINAAVGIFTCVLWIISWIYALSGDMKEVPFVGKYARSFKF